MTMTTSHDLRYGASPEEITAAIDRGGLTYTDDPVPGDIPPPAAPGETVMVNTSLRLPLEVFKGVKALADARGVKFTHMLRRWIEAELASAQAGEPVPREDALRAVEVLRRLGMVA